MKPALAELKTQNQFVCQSWHQAEEGALVYPAMQIHSRLMFQVPMYWTACVGYTLRNEKGQEYNQHQIIAATTRYRLRNISDTFTGYMEDLEQEVNQQHVVGQFYILATGKGRERVFTETMIDKVLDFTSAYKGPARWEVEDA